jgi:hypothetical protein
MLADDLGVSKRVFISEEFVPDEKRLSYFQAADFIMLTYSSAYHSQSATLPTAVAARRMVLGSSGSSPMRDLVRQFGVGVYVDPDSSEAVANAMATLIHAKFPQPDWVGFEEFVTWETNVTRILQAVSDYIAGNPLPGRLFEGCEDEAVPAVELLRAEDFAPPTKTRKPFKARAPRAQKPEPKRAPEPEEEVQPEPAAIAKPAARRGRPPKSAKPPKPVSEKPKKRRGRPPQARPAGGSAGSAGRSGPAKNRRRPPAHPPITLSRGAVRAHPGNPMISRAIACLVTVAFALSAGEGRAIEMFTFFGDGSRIGLPSLEVPVEAYPGIPLRSDRIRMQRGRFTRWREAPRQQVAQPIPEPRQPAEKPAGGERIRPMEAESKEWPVAPMPPE